MRAQVPGGPQAPRLPVFTTIASAHNPSDTKCMGFPQQAVLPFLCRHQLGVLQISPDTNTRNYQTPQVQGATPQDHPHFRQVPSPASRPILLTDWGSTTPTFEDLLEWLNDSGKHLPISCQEHR